ncbi:MAG TPA: hypothetical protein VFS43_03520 [Polyangiaceae bacterium]|nr:hypothetical protein [Polyangiaceae bacterium]
MTGGSGGPGRARAPAGFVEAALRAARRAYPPGNPAGVFAIDVGPRCRRGVEQGEQTLRLFVERKDDRAPGPDDVRFVHAGVRHRLRPDVVATGAPPRAYAAGRRARGSGLHPGAPLLVRDGGARWGGVACVLRSGDGRYLLTAGHLFRPGSAGAEVACARSPSRPLRAIGALFSNLLDLPAAEGDDDPLDAALVALSPEGVSVLEATDGARAPRLANLVDAEAAAEAEVQCYRPTSNDYSPPLGCTFGRQVAYLAAEARPAPVAVSRALRTDFVVTAEGDSGTVLCTPGDERLAAGACVGTDGVGSLFAPLDRCVDRFNELHGLELRLWP